MAATVQFGSFAFEVTVITTRSPIPGTVTRLHRCDICSMDELLEERGGCCRESPRRHCRPHCEEIGRKWQAFRGCPDIHVRKAAAAEYEDESGRFGVDDLYDMLTRNIPCIVSSTPVRCCRIKSRVAAVEIDSQKAKSYHSRAY